MKVFVSKNIKKNPLMRNLAVFFLVFEMLYVAGTVLMWIEERGFSPAAVRSEYLGSENEFIEPKSLTLLLEEVHTRSFFAAILLLAGSSILASTTVAHRLKIVLIYATSAGALTYVLCGPLIRYASPVFLYVMILSFVLYYLGLFAMAALSIAHLMKR